MEPLIEQVRRVVAESLRLGPQFSDWRADTPLLGAVPELDSLAVINVIAALEDRFGIHIDDDEMSGDQFATLGALVEFLEGKISR